MHDHSNTSDAHQELLDACMSRPRLANDEYYVIPVIPAIPMEDPLVHTESRPFCCDISCPCHEQRSAEIVHQYGEGLLTVAEVVRLFQEVQP